MLLSRVFWAEILSISGILWKNFPKNLLENGFSGDK